MKRKPKLIEGLVAESNATDDKLQSMLQLMFKCWRQGYKRSKILPLAQKIEPLTTSEDVSVYFRLMFDAEIDKFCKRSE